MQKEKELVIVEMIGDSNAWQWQALYDDCTPAEALLYYAKEVGMTIRSLTEEDDGWYADEDLRAYSVPVSHTKSKCGACGDTAHKAREKECRYYGSGIAGNEISL